MKYDITQSAFPMIRQIDENGKHFEDWYIHRDATIFLRIIETPIITKQNN